MESLKLLLKKKKDGSFHELVREWKWILGYVKRYKGKILLYVLLGLLATAAGLASSVASKYLIDIVTGFDNSRLGLMAVLLLSTTVGSLLLTSFSNRITARINIGIRNDIGAEIFNKILGVNWLDLSRFHSGDLLNRFDNDVATVSSVAIGFFPSLITGLFGMAGSFALILYYDSTMALIALANAPLLLLCSRFLIKKIKEKGQKVREAESDLLAFETETFQNIDTVKSFDLKTRFHSKLLGVQKKYADISLDYNWFSIKSNAVLSMLALLAQYACFGWGVYRLWSGDITYGTMTLFLTQAAKLSSSFSSLISVVPTSVNAAVAAGRIMEIVELPPEKTGEKEEAPLIGGVGVALKDLQFAYVQDKQVIRSGNLIIKPGEMAALAGVSGEGKTTLMRLLLGLVYPDTGEAYLYDEKGEKRPVCADTRRYFSYVPQGNSVFSGTVAENLRLVREDATKEEMEEALKIACAWTFVEKLPGGLNGVLGEKGRGVSEGQAQRIAIARAVLSKAPVLLLDEATSALDEETEGTVLENLQRCRKDKCCLLVTHRRAALQKCTRVYKIEKGCIEAR